MHIVVAPDKFKGCLTASEVGRAIADGLLSGHGDTTTATVLPVADGGDGTVAAAVAAGFRRVTVEVEGPTGAPVLAPYAIDGSRAVVELAAACGLERLPARRRDPLLSSTFGLGQVIGDAIDRGATDIVVGLGGSASTDGGAGMVQALGASLLDGTGADIRRGGETLAAIRTIELTALRRRLVGVRLSVACDVDNPLLGPRGAAAVFGPQKGAGPEDVVLLEVGLARWADVVTDAIGVDFRQQAGAGAAGGTGFAALAVLGAVMAPGIKLILDLLDFDTIVRGADLVVTGEGSLDEQSLSGKAPVGVAAAAALAGVPTVAVAGRCLLTRERLREADIADVYTLLDLEPNVSKSMAHAADLLRTVGHNIFQDWHCD